MSESMPPIRTASALLGDDRPPISSNSSTLDWVLGGGLRPGCITEIAGEAGAGKTQLGLHYMLQVALASHLADDSSGGCALAISTEQRFPIRRLRSMARCLWDRLPMEVQSRVRASAGSGFSEDAPWASLADLHHIVDAGTPAMVMEAVTETLPHIIRRCAASTRPLRLIIVDSVAGVIRGEFANSAQEMRDRSSFLFALSARLRAIAHRERIAVLVMNQVTDIVRPDHPEAEGPICRASKKPSLGLAWECCVNVRALLARLPSPPPADSPTEAAPEGAPCPCVLRPHDDPVHRCLQLVWHPAVESRRCRVAVEAAGVLGVPSVVG